MIEEPFYIVNKKARLFSVLHHPAQTDSLNGETGIIFCDPFAEEKLWSQRVLVNYARLLSRSFYWVLRFDCMGHGDSDGNYEDASVETQISDIHEAINFLKVKTGVKRLILLGLRFGGTLAAIAAASNDTVDAIVLWNPVTNGEKYFQECLRSNLTTQMTTYHKITYTREQMVRDLLAGQCVNIEGYLISPEFYKQISQLRLVEAIKLYDRPILMVQVYKDEKGKIDKELQELYGALQEAKKPVQYSSIKGKQFWKELNIFAQREDALFETTLDWILKREARPAVESLPSSFSGHKLIR